MASTNSKWRQKRLNLFLRLKNRSDFKLDVERYRTTPDNEKLLLMQYLIRHYHIDGSIIGCLFSYIENQNINDKELASSISPPLTFMHHGYKVRGPLENYNGNVSTLQESYNWYIENNPGIQIPKLKNKLIIEINPNVNKSEFKELLDEYWDQIFPWQNEFQPSEIKGYYRYSKKLFRDTPDKIPIEIKSYIVALNQKGEKSNNISNMIFEKYDQYIEPSNIRSMISRYKKNNKDIDAM